MADRGVSLGEGLFETMRVKGGKVVALELHWHRLSESAKAIEIQLPLTFNELQIITNKLINANSLMTAGLRLTLTSGLAMRGLVADIEHTGSYLLESFALPDVNRWQRLCFSSIYAEPTNPLSRIKSLSYLERVLVKREAVKLGFDDGLQLTRAGNISETSSANFFIVKQGSILTPPLSDGVLPGITRKRLIRFCLKNKIPIQEHSIDKELIYTADGAFISNALIGLIKVQQIDTQYFSNISLDIEWLAKSLNG